MEIVTALRQRCRDMVCSSTGILVGGFLSIEFEWKFLSVATDTT